MRVHPFLLTTVQKKEIPSLRKVHPSHATGKPLAHHWEAPWMLCCDALGNATQHLQLAAESDPSA